MNYQVKYQVGETVLLRPFHQHPSDITEGVIERCYRNPDGNFGTKYFVRTTKPFIPEHWDHELEAGYNAVAIDERNIRPINKSFN